MRRMQQQPLLGILGGMGPLATVDFLRKLTQLTPARCDQEHLPWITVSQPGIPDRSRAIENHDAGPRLYLTEAVAWLAQQGVDLIAIPCSTSHFWFDAMQSASSVPIVHIADAAVAELQCCLPRQAGAVAVLGTRGMIRSGMYAARLAAADFASFALGEAEQLALESIIAAVKGGDVAAARVRMQCLTAELAQHGVGAMILACTELPLACAAEPAVPLIDASQALAKTCLRRLGYLP